MSLYRPVDGLFWIQFKNTGDFAYVVDSNPNGKRWLLSSGRTAKKETEGKTWHRLYILGRIQFLRPDGNLLNVVREDDKCWILGSGRIAKKKTCGETWVWQTPKPSRCATCGSTKKNITWTYCSIQTRNTTATRFDWWCNDCLENIVEM